MGLIRVLITYLGGQLGTISWISMWLLYGLTQHQSLQFMFHWIIADGQMLSARPQVACIQEKLMDLLVDHCCSEWTGIWQAYCWSHKMTFWLCLFFFFLYCSSCFLTCQTNFPFQPTEMSQESRVGSPAAEAEWVTSLHGGAHSYCHRVAEGQPKCGLWATLAGDLLLKGWWVTTLMRPDSAALPSLQHRPQLLLSKGTNLTGNRKQGQEVVAVPVAVWPSHSPRLCRTRPQDQAAQGRPSWPHWPLSTSRSNGWRGQVLVFGSSFRLSCLIICSQPWNCGQCHAVQQEVPVGLQS